MREGVESCLNAARTRNDPVENWDGFVRFAADEILALFEGSDDEALPAHVEEVARRYLEKSREESQR